MINDSLIVSVFEIKYGSRIVEAFRTFIRNGMVNCYWIVRVFGIIMCLGYNMVIGLYIF